MPAVKQEQPVIDVTRNPASTGQVAAAFGRDDFDRDVWSVLGVPIDLATASDAVQAIDIAVRDRRRLSFVTPNVNFLIRSRKDRDSRLEIIDADLSLVDGAPLVALGRLAGVPIRERCAGSDLFDALRRRAAFPGRRLRVFFFGGRDGAAEAAAAAVDAEKRGVEAAGFLNPGHGDVESMSGEAMIETINQSRADFVLVALGAAKGQKWIERNRQRLAAPVIAHLGAVVDFAAGGIRRAPKAVRRLGLEWLWRIKEEPALWRRYFSDGAALAGLVWRDWPCLLATRSAGQIAGACEIRRSGAAATLKFSGDLTAGFRDLLRPALREAAASDGDIVIDLTAARRIDASFLGLLLMFEKAARKNGARILIADPGKRRRRLLEAHGMEYPVAESAEKGGHEEDNAIAAAS